MKKFELTAEYVTNIFGKKLFRIKALVEFGIVKEGELGGFVEKESNIDDDGNAWVSGNAQVFGNAKISGNAQVYGNAKVFGNAWVYGNAWVSGNAQVFGNAKISGNAQVYGNAKVFGNAWVYGNAWISGNAQVYGNAWISGNAQVYGNACVAKNLDYAIVGGFGSEHQTITFFCQKDGSVGAKCGFFYGTLEEFREKVLETHGESKYAQEYLMIADLMELHFAGGCDGNDKDDHSCL